MASFHLSPPIGPFPPQRENTSSSFFFSSPSDFFSFLDPCSFRFSAASGSSCTLFSWVLRVFSPSWLNGAYLFGSYDFLLFFPPPVATYKQPTSSSAAEASETRLKAAPPPPRRLFFALSAGQRLQFAGQPFFRTFALDNFFVRSVLQSFPPPFTCPPLPPSPFFWRKICGSCFLA